MALYKNKEPNSSSGYSVLLYVIKCSLVSFVISIPIGVASAFFLVSLEWVTMYRETHFWIVFGLPLAGLCIGLLYHYFGKEVESGNNLLIAEYYQPQKTIPLKMAPLVYIGTILTHLFGGSAGREGTAVQMGGAIADRIGKVLYFINIDRKILLIIGVSAGFSSVFGTPWAASVFALEIFIFHKKQYQYIIPSVISALTAHYGCVYLGTQHTNYIPFYEIQITGVQIFWVMFCGVIFGLSAWIFSKTLNIFKTMAVKSISWPPLRPLMGGIILSLVVYAFNSTKYIGLGIPIIEQSFIEPAAYYDFILKIIFTCFTIAFGFKGGEVTPLFYIGATLGSALSVFAPLPVSMLAALGFISVFSGATNTPIACAIMGLELFGVNHIGIIFLSSFVAFIFSGLQGIYTTQKPHPAKEFLYRSIKSIFK